MASPIAKQTTNYWCVNFDFEEILTYGLEKNLWMMQYQYALDEDNVFQGEKHRKGAVTANWRRTKKIQEGDWFIAYLPKKKSKNGNSFYAVGKVRGPRKNAKPMSSISTVENYVKIQRSHDVKSGVVYYSDAPMFYEDFDDSWSDADYPEMKYSQRIDVEKWNYVVPEGVPWLSTIEKGPNELVRAFFNIDEKHFDEILKNLQAALNDNSTKNSESISTSTSTYNGGFSESGMPSSQQSWIFQANPKHFKLNEALKQIQVFRWRVNQFKDQIHSGDKVYVWLSGKEPGIVARGTIISNPVMIGEAREELPFMLEKTDGEKKLCVAIEINSVLDDPISRNSLKDHPILSGLSILKQTRGTNFSLTGSHAKSLDDIYPLASIKPLSISEAFKIFLNNSNDQLLVRIRHERARQLQKILANVESIDLARFNREVWVLESETRLDGEDISKKIFSDGLLDTEFCKQISSALDVGTLEMHGNFIWRPGSSIYGAGLKNTTDKQKLIYVRQALQVLNDKALSPYAKAEQIANIPGFGFPTSTALTLLLHPHDVAIMNKQTEGAFEKLQISYKGFPEFHAAAIRLKNQLGAADFIEMDWFLCLINQGGITVANREKHEKMLRELDDDLLGSISNSVSQTVREQLVQARIGQGQFRKNIQQFEKACRVSGVDDDRFLIASHIKPWRASDNQERLNGSNGLFLSPNVDRLFDKGFISFCDDGTLMVSDTIEPETLQLLGVSLINMKCSSFTLKQREFLDYHRTHIFKEENAQSIE